MPITKKNNNSECTSSRRKPGSISKKQYVLKMDPGLRRDDDLESQNDGMVFIYNSQLTINIRKLVIVIFPILLVFLFNINYAQAFDRPVEQNYFASLRSNETNVRAGPGPNYPIKFTFQMRGLPIKVISEYDNWSEIKDYDGDTGWIDQNLITKKRMVLIHTAKTFIDMHAAASDKSKILLRIENNVVGDFIKCSASWCGIKVSGKKGWVKRDELWGIDEKD